MTRRCRAGSLLPLAMLALAVLSLLGLATGTAVVAAHREARVAGQGAHALAAAESAIEAYRWDLAHGSDGPGTPLETLPLPGERVALTRLDVPGVPVRLEVLRAHPLLLWLAAEASAPVAWRSGVAPLARRLERTLWLAPPALPLAAAVTVTGPLHVEPGVRVDGTDRPAPDLPCAAARDTGAVPAWARPEARAADTAQLRARLQERGRWGAAALGGRGASGAWGAIGVTFPGGALTGMHQWRGLLVVDGDLVVRGVLAVDGVLLVLGRLVVEGTLEARGAVTVLARDGGGTTLGAGTRVAYERCAVQMALATVARPRHGPVAHWWAGAP